MRGSDPRYLPPARLLLIWLRGSHVSVGLAAVCAAPPLHFLDSGGWTGHRSRSASAGQPL